MKKSMIIWPLVFIGGVLVEKKFGIFESVKKFSAAVKDAVKQQKEEKKEENDNFEDVI